MAHGLRPGEGSAVINASIHTFVATDGKSISQLGVDLSRATVPDRKYAADTCAVSYAKQTVRIIFGQERFDTGELRSAVAVKMSPRGVVQFLASIETAMPEDVIKAISNDGVEAQNLVSADLEPKQIAVVLVANMAIAAASSSEACVDFYQASPFAMGVAMQSTSNSTAPLAVEAVVRVDLSTGLLLGLIDELKRVRTQFENVQIWRPTK